MTPIASPLPLKVSVITVCLNAAATIEATLQSVRAQTYPHVEHVIIDGASTDGTLDILARYHDHIACLVSEKDAGLYQAMNKGLRRAMGDVIIFMNANDTFADPTVIETVVGCFRRHPAAMIIYGDALFKSGEQIMAGPQPARLSRWRLWAGTVCHQAIFARRSAFARTGYFDESLPVAADWDWLARAVLVDHMPTLHVALDVCVFTLGGICADRAKLERDRAIIHRRYFSRSEQLFFGAREFAARIAVRVRTRNFRLPWRLARLLPNRQGVFPPSPSGATEQAADAEKKGVEVLLVGTVARTGGVSVHVRNLLAALKEAEITAHLLDYEAEHGLLKKFRALARAAIHTSPRTVVHFHVSAMGRFRWAGPLLITLFARQPKVLTIHSGSFVKQMDRPFERVWLRALLACFRRVIAVSTEQRDFLLRLGVPTHKLAVIPAFIPQWPDPTLLPSSVLTLHGGRTLVLTSGSLTPLYDYDLLIDCMAQLDPDQYAFVFAFYGTADPAYASRILIRLDAYANAVVLRDQPPEVFTSLAAVCDLYVRTAIIDGDSNAVREALHFGKTVFATDSVIRPEGCRLFPPSDSAALLRLFHAFDGTPLSGDNGQESNAAHILQLYAELAHGHPPHRSTARFVQAIRRVWSADGRDAPRRTSAHAPVKGDLFPRQQEK